VVQVADGESCDDGNTVSGCRLDKPQKPLDGCLNSCQLPICDDPSKIRLFDELATGNKDLVQGHGRLITHAAMAFESEDFTIRLSRRVCSHDQLTPCSTDEECDGLSSGSTCAASGVGSIVFEQSLPAGSIPHPLPKSWKYKNKLAKTEGGIYALKVVSKVEVQLCTGGSNDDAKCTTDGDCPDGGICLGYYKYSVKAYGDAERALADMQTQLVVGNRTWAVRGIWQRLYTSWKLNKKSIFLDPWP